MVCLSLSVKLKLPTVSNARQRVSESNYYQVELLARRVARATGEFIFAVRNKL